MSDRTAVNGSTSRLGGRVEDEPVVITMGADSYECPDCDVIVVSRGDRVVDLADDHVCRQPEAVR
jgi:hypothetical protein